MISFTIIGLVIISMIWGSPPLGAQIKSQQGDSPAAPTSDENQTQAFEIAQKLKNITIPSIDFSGTKLRDALVILHNKSKEGDASGVGVPIIVSAEVRKDYLDIPITLRLYKISLVDSLRYITSLTKTKYLVTADGIVIQKFTERSNLHSNNATSAEVEKLIHLHARVFRSDNLRALALPETAQTIGTRPKPPPQNTQALGIVRSFDNAKSMKEFLFSDAIESQLAAAKDTKMKSAKIGSENLSLLGILKVSELETFLRNSKNNPDVNLISLPGALVRSGKRGVIASDTVAIGVEPVLGANNFTIDLDLMVRFLGDDIPELVNQKNHRVTLRDGQSAVLAGKPDHEHHLLLVVTARIVDPSGEPIHRNTPKTDRAEFPKKFADGRESAPTQNWQERVSQADALALKAFQLVESDLSSAEVNYREALKILPDRAETAQRKQSYLEQWFQVLKKMETGP